MAQVTTTISNDVNQLLDGAVAAGLYTGRSDAVRDYLRSYIRSNPKLTQKIAVGLYTDGVIDFITACRMADTTAIEMKQLVEQNTRDND